MKRYFAWVPNVIGRLSFSFTGLSHYPERFVFRTNLRDNGRHFVGFQRRDLSDTSVPVLSRYKFTKRLVDRYFFEKSGAFYFLCLLKARDDRQSIQGRVYIFDQDSWVAIRQPVKDAMDALFGTAIDQLPLHKHFADIVLDKHLCVSTLSLKRSGELRVSLEEIRQDNLDNSSSFDYSHAIAAQIYFCVRDMFHAHKFHSPTTDTILDVYEDPENWKEEVNYALARKAIALRRQDTSSSLKRCLGILDYLKAYQENILSEAERQKTGLSIDRLADSAKHGIPLAERREDDSFKSRIQSAAEFILKILAFVFTYATLVKTGTIPLPEDLAGLTKIFLFIQRELLWALLLAGLFAIVVVIATRVRLEERDRFLANIARFSLAYHNKRYAFSMFLVGMAVILFSLMGISWMLYRVLSGPG